MIHRIPSLIRAALLIAGLFTVPGLSAQMLKVGDLMPAISGEDQHGKPDAIAPGTRHVLVSFEMGSGKQANKYLEKQGADYLPDNKAIFIANIYGMPGIGRMFALPKMRKYSHRILLADEKGLLDRIPQEKDTVTVLDLNEEGTITAIHFWTPKDGEAPF